MTKKFLSNKILALIPARQGSERIKDKNIIKINNHPLIAYTKRSKESGLFDKIVVSTDHLSIQKISKNMEQKFLF